MKGNLSLLGPILDENRVFFSDWLIINQYLQTWRLETVTYRPTYPKGTMIANSCISLTMVVTAWHFLHSVCTEFLAINNILEIVALKNTRSIWRHIINMILNLRFTGISTFEPVRACMQDKMQIGNEWLKKCKIYRHEILQLFCSAFWVILLQLCTIEGDRIDKWWRGLTMPNW